MNFGFVCEMNFFFFFFRLAFKIHWRPKKHAKVDFDIVYIHDVMSICDGFRRLSHKIALPQVPDGICTRYENSKIERKEREKKNGEKQTNKHEPNIYQNVSWHIGWDLHFTEIGVEKKMNQLKSKRQQSPMTHRMRIVSVYILHMFWVALRCGIVFGIPKMRWREQQPPPPSPSPPTIQKKVDAEYACAFFAWMCGTYFQIPMHSLSFIVVHHFAFYPR